MRKRRVKLRRKTSSRSPPTARFSLGSQRKQSRSLRPRYVHLELFGKSSQPLDPTVGWFTVPLPKPKLDSLGFSVHRQVLDENGILNPVVGEDSYLGSLQVNVYGDSEGYRALGQYLLSLGEFLEACDDPDYHAHFDDSWSQDRRTHVNFILRRCDPRPAPDVRPRQRRTPRYARRRG
jgi:hypothetical protein